MVYRSRKKVNEPVTEGKKKKSFSIWQKALQGVSQVALRWGKQAVVCDPGRWLVIDGCIRHSDCWETAAMCVALSSVFLHPQQSDFQSTRKEGKHLFTKYVTLQTLDLDLPFSWCGTRTDLCSLEPRYSSHPWKDSAGPSLHPCSAGVTFWEQLLSQRLCFQASVLTVAEKVCQKGSQLSLGTEDRGWIMNRAKRWEVSSSSALPWSSSPSLIYVVLMYLIQFPFN